MAVKIEFEYVTMSRGVDRAFQAPDCDVDDVLVTGVDWIISPAD